MQKKLKSLFMAASLAVASTLVFVACGAGDIKDIVESDFGNAKDHAEVILNSVLGNLPSYVEESSSSVEPPPLSSSEIQQSSAEIQQSSAAPPQSSAVIQQSSGGSTSSSSASPPKSSSSSVAKSSAVAAQGKCRENNPKSGFTCGWDGYSATKILTPGTMLKPATATPPSGCTVKWNFAPDTSGMMLNYSCGEVPAAGESALGSSNYVLFAELTCDDGVHINACNPKTGWSSKQAPELSGKCRWDKDPPDVTSARGAKPSGVTVVDDGKVCTNPTVVYKYDDQKKTWPSTGILDEWKSWGKDKSEIYKVEAVLNCPAYSQVVAMACPDLKVSGGVEHVIECTCGSGDQCQVNDKICKADGKTGNTVTLTTSECVEVTVYKYNNPHYVPEVGMRCASKNNDDFVVSVNGKSTTVKGNGLVPIGKLKVEDETSLGTLCLTSGASSISCSGPGQ